MEYFYQYKQLASTEYNEGAYGANTYSGEASSETGTPGSGGGDLAYTGYDVILPAALGLAVVAASAILLVKKFLRRKQA